MEGSRVGAALMLFSLPKALRTRGTSALAGIPACLIAGQTALGRTEFELPRHVLARTVPRRSLAVMIHTILPVLELAESAVRPRWRWMSHPSAQLVVGLVLFLLSLAIAIPVLDFTVHHAASMFTLSLGVVERDGLVMAVGLLAGISSLAAAAAGAFSGRRLLARSGRWLKSFVRRLGVKVAKHLLRRLNPQLADLLTIEWSGLSLLWDPEAAPTPPDTDATKSRLALMREKRRSPRAARGVLPVPA
jgi:hypothetical protein